MNKQINYADSHFGSFDAALRCAVLRWCGQDFAKPTLSAAELGELQSWCDGAITDGNGHTFEVTAEEASDMYGEVYAEILSR